jgi:uncharacterized RmlC-like cupin family protein
MRFQSFLLNSALTPSVDTIVYAVSGRGAIVSEDGKKRQDLSPGDFALIPSYVRQTCIDFIQNRCSYQQAKHQEVNDGDEELRWVIVRGGRSPIVHNLEDWEKS